MGGFGDGLNGSSVQKVEIGNFVSGVGSKSGEKKSEWGFDVPKVEVERVHVQQKPVVGSGSSAGSVKKPV